jgi:replicative DNA helicase
MNTIPSDSQVEKLVIGCCIAGGTVKAELATQQLTPGDFGDLRYSEAFRVITSLVTEGQAVDETSLSMAWRKIVSDPRECPSEVWTAGNDVPSAEQLPVYIAELKQLARRRLAWTTGHRLIAESGNPKRDIAELCASATAALEGNDREASQDTLDGAGLCSVLMDDLERRHALKGELSGIGTGFPDLDKLTDGLQAGELSVIGARPSQGKTALLLAIALHASFRGAVPTLIISLEMSAAALMRRLASMETGIPLSRLRSGQLEAHDFKTLTTFQARLKKSGLAIFDGSTGSNVNRFAGIVRWHVEKRGVKLVVLDYLQKVRPTTRHEKRTYEVAEVSGSLKAIASRHGIHVCTAAQLNREPDKLDRKGNGKLPKLSDLADSGQIERDADLVGLLHRERSEQDPQGEPAFLFVAKQRDGEIGNVPLRFNPKFCRFESRA